MPPILAPPDSDFNAKIRKEKSRFERPSPHQPGERACPAETRTYQVLCSTCPHQTLLLSGPHDSGSEYEFAALRQAEKMKSGHAALYPGHRTYLLMHTQNTLLSTGVCLDEAVRS